MQLVVDNFEELAGVVLQPASGPLTDDEFFALCARYPDNRIETTAEGDVVIMPPTHPRTGQRNSVITSQLAVWSEQDGRGEAFDSSSGFFLPSGARRSPDAAWITKDRLAGLNDQALWHVTPEFVIELKSASDRLPVLRKKMKEWIANGVSLGWLIDPDQRAVEIYRASGDVVLLENPTEVNGEGPVSGFVLRMPRIWEGIRTR